MDQPTTSTTAPPPTMGSRELVALLGLSTSAAALGIDAMLPAFADMRSDLGLAPDSTAVGAVISSFFAGLAVGQLLYGPLADRFGRRPVLRAAFVGYVVMAIAASFSPDLTTLVILRFGWGLAAAGPRVIAMAIVRDRYDGAEVSQVMSSLMAVFILVPIVAPLIGAGFVAVASWRLLFVFCALFALALLAWSSRLDESLRPEHRMELSAGRIVAAGRRVMTTRATVTNLVAVSALMTSFVAYLGGFETIIDQVYDKASWFPFIFGLLAAVMGVFMAANRRLVTRWSAEGVARRAFAAQVVISVAFTVVAAASDGRPPLWLLLVGMGGVLSCNALLLPNLTALSIEPLGEIAGTAASVIGAVQTAIGALAGSALLTLFGDSATPMMAAFAGASIVGAVVAALGRTPTPTAG